MCAHWWNLEICVCPVDEHKGVACGRKLMRETVNGPFVHRDSQPLGQTPTHQSTPDTHTHTHKLNFVSFNLFLLFATLSASVSFAFLFLPYPALSSFSLVASLQRNRTHFFFALLLCLIKTGGILT